MNIWGALQLPYQALDEQADATAGDQAGSAYEVEQLRGQPEFRKDHLGFATRQKVGNEIARSLGDTQMIPDGVQKEIGHLCRKGDRDGRLGTVGKDDGVFVGIVPILDVVERLKIVGCTGPAGAIEI